MKVQITSIPKHMKRGGRTNRQSASQDPRVMQLIQAYAKTAGVDPAQIMQVFEKMNPQQKQQAVQKMASALQGGGQQQNPQEEQAEQGQNQNPQEEQQEYALGGPTYKEGFSVSPTRNTGIGYYNPHLYESKVNIANIDPIAFPVTSSVKPVDKEDATIEAEKGEKIITPDLSGIYEIQGKKHSQGGTALNPKPGSFIFSNDPKLYLTKEEKKAFEFKEGGSTAKSKNTPSKVLGREIDMKEFNRYTNILQDPKADKISKATATLMLDKFKTKIGQIAYLQESKKNAEIPDFAMGSAPMKNPELEQQEAEQEMYKFGGIYAEGGVPCPCGTDANGNCLPCSDAQYQKILDSGKAKKVDTPPEGYDRLYGTGNTSLYGQFGKTPGNKKQMTNYAWNKYLENETPAQRLKRKLREQSEGVNTEDYVQVERNINLPPLEMPQRHQYYMPGMNLTPPAYQPPQGVLPGTPPPPENGTPPTLPYKIKGKLNWAQKADLARLGFEAMGIKKYMPMREQIALPDVSLDKQNFQPMQNAIRNQEFQAYNALGAIDPRNAKLMASNIAGKGMDQEVQAQGQVDSTNIQIGNQENMTNLQQANQEEMFNVPATGKYYDSTVVANQNFDDERRFARNQVASTYNKYKTDADTLAWKLASINKYGRRAITDKNGKIIGYQPVPLYEWKDDGINYNSDVASLNMASGRNQANSMDEAKKMMEAFGLDTKDKASIFAFAKLYAAFSNNGKNPLSVQDPN